ncbi:MAG: dihydrofolate reductase [Treponema sp.]|jgi:dihydrofolate reductase|nr:dihydrofolate reductase [Treponema sp.]
MDIIIIAAMSENRVIGVNNALPWALKADMERFKKLTLGWPCIMGRKTWESLPKRPLPGRPNMVISRSLNGASRNDAMTGAKVFPSLQKAVGHCAGYEKVFICGGASIYAEVMPLADRIELTVIHKQYEGDAFFPEIASAQWKITQTEDFDGFSFISYSRI